MADEDAFDDDKLDEADGAAPAAGPSPERLAAKHQQVLFGDYFQILELPRDADALAVARAATALTEEFRLDGASTLSAEDQVKLRLVVAVLRDAVHVLGDAGLRSRYARSLPSPR